MDMEELSNRKRQLQRQLDDQEEVLVGPAPVAAEPVASALDSRIATLQQQLDSLRLRYTDLHPEITRVKQLIARLEDQKRQEDEAARRRIQGQPVGSMKSQNPIYQQLSIAIAEADANLASMKARVGQLQARRTELYRSIDRIPQIEAEYTQLMRDYDVYKSNYAQFLQRRETAVISGDVESKADAVDFRVIDPPRVPSKPAWPNRPMLVSAAPLAGFGAGLGLAFLLGQLRPTVDSRRQLRDLTGLPLLGVVTRTQSELVLRHARRRNLMFFAALLAMLVAYLGQMVYYLFISAAA